MDKIEEKEIKIVDKKMDEVKIEAPKSIVSRIFSFFGNTINRVLETLGLK